MEEMVNMIRNFWVMVMMLVLMVGGVAVHYLSFDRSRIDRGVVSGAALLRAVFPAFSVAYYEPRTPYDSHNNPAYPEMEQINKMDFVYERQ